MHPEVGSWPRQEKCLMEVHNCDTEQDTPSNKGYVRGLLRLCKRRGGAQLASSTFSKAILK
jgi:hypothetical protein